MVNWEAPFMLLLKQQVNSNLHSTEELLNRLLRYDGVGPVTVGSVSLNRPVRHNV